MVGERILDTRTSLHLLIEHILFAVSSPVDEKREMEIETNWLILWAKKTGINYIFFVVVAVLHWMNANVMNANNETIN